VCVPFEIAKSREVRERRMASRGWGIVTMSPNPGDSYGGWSYTVGLTTRGFPELLSIGYDGQLEELGRQVWDEGRTFTDGDRITGVGAQPIEIRDVTVHAVRSPELALTLYGDTVRLQQMIVADADGLFPWESGNHWSQPILDPPPPQPEPGWLFRVDSVALLPRPDPVTDPACMGSSLNTLRHLARRITARPGPRDCCWFHTVNWRTATEAAITVLGDDLIDLDRDVAAALATLRRGLDPVTAAAAATLLTEPLVTGHPDENSTYRDGGRRLRAMFDQGVRRTVLAQWYVPHRIGG
jgi:hypothetical protein